jgi:ubiquinone/menaquinone biosynthesis C-methylase UbiE
VTDRSTPADDNRIVVGVFNRAAETYESIGVEFFSLFGRWLVEAAAPAPGERVLDVGCGRGAATIPAALTVGAAGHVTAFDLAPRMVELLQADIAARGLNNVDVRIGDAQAPGGEPASFDCVLASLVIFLLPDPDAALRAWFQLLRPGGRIAIATFGADDERWSWMRDLRRFVPEERRRSRDLADPRWRDAQHVRDMLSGAGFSDVVSREREQIVRFRDVDHWVTWTHSQGQRFLWEQIPASRHDEMTRIAAEYMQSYRDPDGTIPLRSILRITTGRRPA